MPTTTTYSDFYQDYHITTGNIWDAKAICDQVSHKDLIYTDCPPPWAAHCYRTSDAHIDSYDDYHDSCHTTAATTLSTFGIL